MAKREKRKKISWFHFREHHLRWLRTWLYVLCSVDLALHWLRTESLSIACYFGVRTQFWTGRLNRKNKIAQPRYLCENKGAAQRITHDIFLSLAANVFAHFSSACLPSLSISLSFSVFLYVFRGVIFFPFSLRDLTYFGRWSRRVRGDFVSVNVLCLSQSLLSLFKKTWRSLAIAFDSTLIHQVKCTLSSLKRTKSEEDLAKRSLSCSRIFLQRQRQITETCVRCSWERSSLCLKKVTHFIPASKLFSIRRLFAHFVRLARTNCSTFSMRGTLYIFSTARLSLCIKTMMTWSWSREDQVLQMTWGPLRRTSTWSNIHVCRLQHHLCLNLLM